ncbi:MAG: UDP binding domain-containing protein [Christensenellales bacterium]
MRNTKVIDIVHTLEEYKANVTLFTTHGLTLPLHKHEYGIELHSNIPEGKYDAIILAVAHDKFKSLDITKITNGNRVVYDVKGVWEKR